MSSESDMKSRGWFSRRRNQALVFIVVFFLVLVIFSNMPQPPRTKYQVALDRAVSYFGANYNTTVGLIPEEPGGKTFWLYSDNYLVSLAVSRYPDQNQSVVDLWGAVRYVVGAFGATIPGGIPGNQYSALNSTVAPFGCPEPVSIGWTPQTGVSSSGTAAIRTTANAGGPACAGLAANYADLLFLQAVRFHRLGNSSAALTYFHAAASDFNGQGVADRAYTDNTSSTRGQYQTFKVALLVYSTYCLGQQAAANSTLTSALGILMQAQDPASGGFETGYVPIHAGNRTITPLGSVNTETTALAALALELAITPTSAC